MSEETSTNVVHIVYILGFGTRSGNSGTVPN